MPTPHRIVGFQVQDVCGRRFDLICRVSLLSEVWVRMVEISRLISDGAEVPERYGLAPHARAAASLRR